jgi:transcriptional regulator with XRE-family HTH domain
MILELHLGSRIRRLRLEQRRTQREIADACGFTKSLLSKIERDRVMPPVATLVKIANALGTRISVLIEAGTKVPSVVTTGAEVAEGMISTDQGYRIHPYATRFERKRMQPFMFTVRRGEVKEHHLAHEGEEFLYVLDGCVRVQVGPDEHVLNAGDALYFDAAYIHQVIPVSEEARYLDIFG